MPSDEEAVIYYYRPKRFVGSAVYYDVKNNGNVVSTLYNGSYFSQKVSSGKNFIEASTESTDSLDFSSEKGKVYFVRGSVNMGFLIGRPKLDLISENQALKEIQDCRIVLNE